MKKRSKKTYTFTESRGSWKPAGWFFEGALELREERRNNGQ